VRALALERVGMSGQIVDRDLHVVRIGPPQRRAEREGAVRDHARARLLGDAHGPAEVVGVRVRDEHAVDVARLEPLAPHQAAVKGMKLVA